MRILNFGSMNIDYVYKVNQLVRPGETISSHEMKSFCGGKGLNQSVAIARAGFEIFHAGKIGINGEILREYLINNSVNTDLIENVTCPPGHAVIQVDSSGQNSIILYGGSNQSMTCEYVDKVLSKFGRGDMILLQNEINFNEYIINKASEREMAVILNPSPIDGNLKKYPLELVKYFILNELEGYELTGKTNADEISEEMLRKYPDSSIVLTLGKKGVMYLDNNIRIRHGIYEVKVVDTTAAGDTFTGYFVAGLAEGLPIDKNLERASIASSISVSRLGASDSIPYKEEIDRCKLAYIDI